MMSNSKKLIIEDICLSDTELTDAEAQCINGGAPTLPLPPPSSFSLFSFDWVVLNPQPLPPRVLSRIFYS